MKRLLLALSLITTLSVKAQQPNYPQRYAVFFDSTGVQHTSVVPTKMSSITGSYFDLVTKPTTVSQFGVADMVSISALNTALAPYTPTASYSTVATTGSYNDLLNKPAIPIIPVTSVFGRTGDIVRGNTDYTTTQIAEGTNLYWTPARISTALSAYTPTSSLSVVATTGNYNDLLNKPTIPNQSVSSVFGRTGVIIPASGDYNTSQVPEGSNLYYTTARITTALTPYSTTSQANALYAPINGSPNYAPTTGSLNYAPATGSNNYVNISAVYNNPPWLNTFAYNKLTGTPIIYSFSGTSTQYTKGDGTYGTLPSSYIFTGLSTQYTKGDGTYGTLPNLLSSFTNDPGYISKSGISAAGSLSYNSITGVFSYTQPVNVSSFANDAGFVTSSTVRTSISAVGSLNYNSTTGVLSYTAPTVLSAFTNDANFINLAGARAAISASGNLSYSPTTGVISYTQPTTVSTFTNDAGYIPNATALTDIANANINQVSTTTSYTITAANFVTGKKPELFISCDATGGNITTTLPSATTYNGFIIHVGKVDASANIITISGLASDNKEGTQGQVKDMVAINNVWTQK